MLYSKRQYEDNSNENRFKDSYSPSGGELYVPEKPKAPEDTEQTLEEN